MAYPEIRIAVVFASLPLDQPAASERQLLCEFEDEFWDIPVLNSQRGYARDADVHYRG